MHLRRATLADATALGELAQCAYRETFHHYEAGAFAEFLTSYYSPRAFSLHLADKHKQLWLAESEGRPAAYTMFGACSLPGIPDIFPAIELHRLYVLKSHQGKKFGAALMDKFWEAAATQGAKAAYLGVWSGNINAQAFYRKYGFEKIGEYDYPPIGEVVDREWIFRKAL